MDKTQTHDRFAAATDRTPSTFEKIGASLGRTPFGLPGGHGGGTNARHSTSPYLAGLIFGAGSYQPKDGYEVAMAAAACEYRGSAFYFEDKQLGGVLRSEPQLVDVAELGPGSTAMSYVQERIEFYAGEPEGTPQTMMGRPLLIDESLIRIDFDPFAARVEWRAEDGLLLVHHFMPEQELAKRRHMDPKAAAKEMARIRRSSILPASLIFVAARILADGWVKTGKKLPGSGQGGALAGASSDSERPANEKTPGFAEPGASRHSNQSRDQRETGPNYARPDTKRACVKSQARAGSRGRLLTEHRRHGARSEDPPRFGLFAAGYP
jgi:hypothetical protein